MAQGVHRLESGELSERVYARFENDILPYIGDRPIAEITPKEFLSVIPKIENRDAKDTAHRTFGSADRCFDMASRPADVKGTLRSICAAP